MGIMGRLTIFFGILAALTIFMANVVGLVGGIVSLILGIWTLNAASSFRRIAATEGGDIRQLMNATVNLKKLYRLQVIVLLIWALVVIACLAYAFLGMRAWQLVVAGS